MKKKARKKKQESLSEDVVRGGLKKKISENKFVYFEQPYTKN